MDNSADDQLNENCDETVSPEIDEIEPVIDLGTDSDQNSDKHSDNGSKVHCWNEFQGKWLSYGDAITEGSMKFDNIEDAIIECDRLGDANCQGILVKTGRSSFKLR